MTLSRALALLPLLALLAACPDRRDPRTDEAPGQAAWPALPGSAAAARRLIARRTLRPPPAARQPELSAGEVLRLLRGGTRQGSVVAGWPAITRRIKRELDLAVAAGRHAYLLWGVYHDSGPQVQAFGRLVRPLGLGQLSAVVAEPFQASGSWRGVDGLDQRGDSQLMARYLATGSRADLALLAASQRRHNYTAWKFGYLAQMQQLLLTARASGNQLLGCDMPAALKARLKALPVESRLRLRELHCLLALARALARMPAPHRVAMLWGQEHVAPTGLPRFLPPRSRVLSVAVFGHRPGPHGLEQALARTLLLSHPVMIPRGTGGQWILLLPGPLLGLRVERARHRLDAPLPAAQRGLVMVRAAASGRLVVGAVSRDITATAAASPPVSLRPGAGTHAFVLHSGDRLLAGALEVPRSARLDLDLDLAGRAAQLTLVR